MQVQLTCAHQWAVYLPHCHRLWLPWPLAQSHDSSLVGTSEILFALTHRPESFPTHLYGAASCLICQKVPCVLHVGRTNINFRNEEA